MLSCGWSGYEKGASITMHVEEYDLDSLRKLVRSLQGENKALKQLLDKAGIPYEQQDVFSETLADTEQFDPDQG